MKTAITYLIYIVLFVFIMFLHIAAWGFVSSLPELDSIYKVLSLFLIIGNCFVVCGAFTAFVIYCQTNGHLPWFSPSNGTSNNDHVYRPTYTEVNAHLAREIAVQERINQNLYTFQKHK